MATFRIPARRWAWGAGMGADPKLQDLPVLGYRWR